ncbi:hypothetical protein PY479_02070 [Shewanella sp. A32]|uniref:hypothetical protein n=1 Tax=Shewanella sp. A32 TaxID=3031327 RepID=UPI0023B90869|nr:hypothetical protein [Shewanella sp. A32]MDF0533062.1 hypothetical protein [Shewanella sp. A32]
MLKITTENLPKLGRIYLRNVLQNMRNYEESAVKFGLLGEMKFPNYQVTLPNGRIITYRGINHDQFGKDDFEVTHLSESFSFSQIKAARENSSEE